MREPEPPPEARRSRDEEEGVLAKAMGSSVFRSFARSAASAAGREISRSLFGTAPRRAVAVAVRPADGTEQPQRRAPATGVIENEYGVRSCR